MNILVLDIEYFINMNLFYFIYRIKVKGIEFKKIHNLDVSQIF